MLNAGFLRPSNGVNLQIPEIGHTAANSAPKPSSAGQYLLKNNGIISADRILHSDVLRDHFSRCERRGSSAIPSSLERGRKRHACDECSRLKVKCDNNIPCRKCTEFGRKCVKTRPSGMLLERQRYRTKAHHCAKASASSPEAATPPQPSTPDTISDRNSIGFLLNCPGETDFLQEFPKSSTLSPNSKAEDGYSSSPTARPEFAPITTIPPAPAGPYQEYGHMIQANNLDVFLSHLEFQTFETETHNWQMPGENMILWSGRDALFIDRSVLERKAFEIKEKLRFTAASQTPGNLPSPELLQ